MEVTFDALPVPSPAPLGVSDQACNECRRRKSKCDRILPECGLCFKQRRHCLYEQHSKTPLTRKHLTEVEEKLRRAEARLRAAERRAARAEAARPPNNTGLPTPSQTDGERPSLSRVSTADTTPSVPLHAVTVNGWQPMQVTELPVQPSASSSGGHTSHPAIPRTEAPASTSDQAALSLESPPRATDDFSWDEQSPQISVWQSHPIEGNNVNGEDDNDGRAADGMATLNIEDRDAGYLGLASGAAMLRLLLPDGDPRDRMQFRRTTISSQPRPTADSPLDASIPTPLYRELRIANIDMDAAIDAYFGLYHLSYPIVHEPTFRAQYSQVIPRPASSSWNALAYMIAAIGSWTTTAGADSTDLDLFMAAKTNISADSLETGNITLVQVLTLMSNYLQKRNKPNSGYNYLGLALHMAMGLGLHKNFSNWNIPPLNLEVRRRVWWCLFVFYTGAAITFGRPVVWPHHEVVLPLNIRDRVCFNPTRTYLYHTKHLTNDTGTDKIIPTIARGIPGGDTLQLRRGPGSFPPGD
jgi:transcriptional regulatory protein GAL4